MFNQGLGPESDTQAGDAEHRQVVGAVPHGDNLLQVYALLLGQLAQQLRLAVAIHDGSLYLPRHQTVGDVQLVGVHVIDPQVLLQIAGKVGETAG